MFLQPLYIIIYIYVYIACYYVVAMCYISRTGSYRPVYHFQFFSVVILQHPVR